MSTDSELRRQETHSPPRHLLLKQSTLYISSSENTSACPQILNYEGRKHTAPHTFITEAAYAVHFFQRGYSAHPQILNYEGRKHTAPHTFTAEAAYAVHFLQRGYSACPQILNYEGRKHTAPHRIYY